MKQNEILARTVRDARARTGLSQKEVAERASGNVPGNRIPENYIASLELARVQKPSVDRLERIAAVLELHPDVLMRAAGYRVNEPPPIKEKTTADILAELARHLKNQERKARDGDPHARLEVQQVASFFSRVLIPA